jgi:hypothetical protein
MTVLADNTMHAIRVFRCDHGGIHLVYHNVNISMTPPDFTALSARLQDALLQVDSGNWEEPYASIRYNHAILFVEVEVFPVFAKTVFQAAAQLERLELRDDTDEGSSASRAGVQDDKATRAVCTEAAACFSRN